MMSAERAIQTVDPTVPVITVKDSILRAASNPNIDPERMERFLQMFERMEAREAEVAFNEAMNAAQTGMRAIGKDAQSDKGKYASFVALDKAARPIYSAQGFSLSFDTGDGAPPDHVRLLCYVSHRGGHTRTYHVDMPADGKGAKGNDVMTKTHATGAAMTYGQRYLFRLIFNLAVGEDNDGYHAREQSAGASAAIAAVNACKTVADLKAWKSNNAANLSELPTEEADEIVRLWNRRIEALR